MRLMGCLSSEWILPTRTALMTLPMKPGMRKLSLRKKKRRSAGSSVMARNAATTMAKFLV